MLYRWINFLFVSLILLLSYSPSAAAAPASDVRLDAQAFFEGTFRAGDWLPIRITVANDGPDISAVVSVQAGAIFETTLELPRGANKSVVLYVQPNDMFRRSLPVRLMIGGSEVIKVDVPVKGLDASTRVIGVLTSQPLTLPLPPSKAPNQRFETVQLTSNALPENSAGLSMFDLLIVDGAPLTGLSAEQQQALSDWVRTGGQLVVGGTDLSTTLQQLPQSLRTVEVGVAAPRGPISLLAELAQAPPATTLISGAATRTIARTGDAVVGVQHEIGSGRVTALGFSLAAPELAQLPLAASFWAQVARFPTTGPEGWQMPAPEEAQAQQLGFALTQLPVLAMPPLGVLGALLGIYVLLIGPGMYLILHRLDRLAWGWVIIPVVTIVFSLGAYGYGLRLRGNDVILNQISVVEPDDGIARVRSYAGVFSPSTETYTVRSSTNALFKPMVLHGGGPGGTAAGRYQQGENGIRDLEVAQWSMSNFVVEQLVETNPLSVELTLEDATLRGTVRNMSANVVRDVALVQNMRVARIGNLEPGQSRSVELKLDENVPNNWGMAISTSLLQDKWDFNKPVPPPAEIRMQQAVLDAMFNPSSQTTTKPLLIGWMEQTPLQLTIDHDRVHYQHLTLLSQSVDVNFAEQGRVRLPQGWLRADYEVAIERGGGICISQWGSGWYVESGKITTTLELPPMLEPLNIDGATINVRSDGVPPTVRELGVYDWTADQWIEQPTQATLQLEKPERYVGPSGLVRVRASIQNDIAKGGGCTSIDVGIEGALP